MQENAVIIYPLSPTVVAFRGCIKSHLDTKGPGTYKVHALDSIIAFQYVAEAQEWLISIEKQGSTSIRVTRLSEVVPNAVDPNDESPYDPPCLFIDYPVHNIRIEDPLGNVEFFNCWEKTAVEDAKDKNFRHRLFEYLGSLLKGGDAVHVPDEVLFGMASEIDNMASKSLGYYQQLIGGFVTDQDPRFWLQRFAQEMNMSFSQFDMINEPFQAWITRRIWEIAPPEGTDDTEIPTITKARALIDQTAQLLKGTLEQAKKHEAEKQRVFDLLHNLYEYHSKKEMSHLPEAELAIADSWKGYCMENNLPLPEQAGKLQEA